MFHFSFSRVGEVSNCVREALLRCTLLYVWMVVLVFGLKGYRAYDVEEMSPGMSESVLSLFPE